MTRLALLVSGLALVACAHRSSTPPAASPQAAHAPASAAPRSPPAGTLPCSIEEILDDGPGGSLTVNRFDAVHRLLATDIDFANDGSIDHEYRRYYDDAGHLIAASTPSADTRYELDDHGRIIGRFVQDHGYTPVHTTMTYDGSGRVVVERSDADEVQFEYDGAGRLVRARRFALGTTTVLAARARSYDGAGHLIREQRDVDSVHLDTRWKYDAAGNQVEQLVLRSHQLYAGSRRYYDAYGRMTSQDFLDADGQVAGQGWYVHDATGNPVRTEEVRNGHRYRTHYTYCDAAGPPIEAPLPLEP